jgi:hypothetical protein
MLSGSELTTAIAVVLMGAVLVGVLLHWFWTYLSRPKGSDTSRLDEMAVRLHEADVAREEAEGAHRQAEALLARRDAEAAEQIALMQARMGGENAGREAELTKELEAVRLELEAARKGPRTARQRVTKRKPKSKR